VLSPEKTQSGAFSLTQLGMAVLARCTVTSGFHVHIPDKDLFMPAHHVENDEKNEVVVTDLRQPASRKKFLGIF